MRNLEGQPFHNSGTQYIAFRCLVLAFIKSTINNKMPTHITSHQLSHRFCSIKPYIIKRILYKSSHKNGRDVMPIRAGGKRRCCPAILCPKHSMFLLHYALHIKYSLLTVLIVYHNNVSVSRNIVKNTMFPLGNHIHKQYIVLLLQNYLLVRKNIFS